VRTLRRKVRDKFGSNTASPDFEKMINWLPQENGGERRRALRRVGPPTAVRIATTLAEAPTATTTSEGLVLDRSTGGLCFATEREFQPGDVVFLRVTGTGTDCPWVAVVVRHCCDYEEFFLVGCEFRESLPLTVQLLFG